MDWTRVSGDNSGCRICQQKYKKKKYKKTDDDDDEPTLFAVLL